MYLIVKDPLSAKLEWVPEDFLPIDLHIIKRKTKAIIIDKEVYESAIDEELDDITIIE